MLPFDSIQDAGLSFSSQWYRDMKLSSKDLNDSDTRTTRDMDTIETSLFSHILTDDDSSRYLYQIGQAVSLIQSYQRSTQDLSSFLDEMKSLVNQAVIGDITSLESQSSQTRWKTLAQAYDDVISESSEKVGLRLDNEAHALGMIINSNQMVDVRTADLRFDVGQRNVITEAETLLNEITTQQGKVDDYQTYLSSRLSFLIDEQASSFSVNYASSMRHGVNIQNESFGRQLVQQITNTTMQLGVSIRQAFKTPGAMRVQFHTSAEFPPFLWMLS